MAWNMRSALILTLMAPLWVGCAEDDALEDQDLDTGEGDGFETSAGGTSGAGGSDGDDSPGSTDPSGGDPSGGSDTAGDSDGGPGDGGGGDGAGGEAPEPGQLTAGEWRDLDNWSYWLDLMQSGDWQTYVDGWNFHTTQRFAVAVTSDEGVSLADVPVSLVAGEAVLWSARTDVHGRAELFAGALGEDAEGPFSVHVEGEAVAEEVEPTSEDPIVIELPEASEPENVLDLMLMIDTTGSMGDELSYLQVELADVVDEVQTMAGDLEIRLSVNFYRDQGDAYVVREFPFTTDIDAALADLAAQGSDGGGNYPEAVVEALDSAVAAHQWSPSARARLLFLVLDAPPHRGSQGEALMNQRVQEAAEAGIRIIPVASSGVDKDTEFFLRFIDILTGGTYVFLTNDSGIGGDHIEPTIGEYEVEFLNDLLVRLIGDAI